MTSFRLLPQDEFHSFDGGVSIVAAQVRPAQNALKDCSEIEEKVLARKRHRIARGAGLSLAGASFGQETVSIDTSSFTQITGLENGVVEVEAGVSLARLFNYLAAEKRYLSVQANYPAITVAGCIASDAHGASPLRNGNFRNQVVSLKLFHPQRGIISAGPEVNPDIFELTLGGYGLTGQIISAKLRTKPLVSSRVSVETLPLDNPLELPMLLRRPEYESVYSWHDFSAQGESFGRGFLVQSRFVSSDRPARRMPEGGFLSAASRRGLDMEFYSMAFNRLVNVLYGGMHRFSREPQERAVDEMLFPAWRARELYFKLFGRTGFHEIQLLIPDERFPAFFAAVRKWLGENELAVTLASARAFDGSQSLLRFDGKGICFTLNFPRCPAARRFLTFLDDLSLDLGLIPNLVKDSRLSLKLVASVYPEYMMFRQKLRAFDRERLYRSELSQRLEL